MHTTASSVVATTQYIYKLCLLCFSSVIIINIEAVNDYLPIRFEIRFGRKFPIRRSLL